MVEYATALVIFECASNKWCALENSQGGRSQECFRSVISSGSPVLHCLIEGGATVQPEPEFECVFVCIWLELESKGKERVSMISVYFLTVQ